MTYEEARSLVKDEYRKIAFAPIGSDVKCSDKLRALDAYISMCASDEGLDPGLPMAIKVEYV